MLMEGDLLDRFIREHGRILQIKLTEEVVYVCRKLHRGGQHTFLFADKFFIKRAHPFQKLRRCLGIFSLAFGGLGKTGFQLCMISI